MLRLRIISALIAAPLAVAAIFLLPLAAFAVVFLAVASLALFEWGELAGLKGGPALAGYLLLYWALAAMLWNFPDADQYLLWLGLLFWVWACSLVLRFPGGTASLDSGWFVALLGLIVFLAAWQSLVILKALDAGAWLLVWVFVLVWGADVGGYFAGKAWGVHKLAKKVSPGKTWEGAGGGLVLAVVAALCMALLLPAFDSFALATWQWLFMALLLISLSIMGDLFESVLKRVRGVKDSGGIMPGHGGLLDRVDALIAALPLFALFMTS